MSPSHWDKLYQQSPLQEPQSTRFAEILAGVKQQIAGIGGRLLLLSVSPTLSSVAPDVTAVDHNASVIRHRWPGNTPNRRAVAADWWRLPFADRSFAACVGDGSTNIGEYSQLNSLYDSLARVMMPGARLVCRMYLTPDIGESLADVAKVPWQGQCRSFVYFRFRLAMAMAAERGEPDVPVQSIREVFNAHFPDRDRLAASSGWSRSEIDRIDLYNSSPEVYNFPTRQQVMAVIPRDFLNPRFVPVGTYELAERCPLLVTERR